MVLRYPISFGLAAAVTFGLFWVMQALIAMGDGDVKKVETIRVVDFVRVKRTATVQEKERAMPERPENMDQPPAPNLDMPSADVGEAGIGTMAIKAPTAANVPLKLKAGPKLGPPPVSDSAGAPLLRIKPEYPMRARQDGIEGWVRIRFDIDPNGNVQNAQVMSAQPRGVFESAALRAIRRWRYRAKVEGGKPVWQRGKAVKMPFRLSD